MMNVGKFAMWMTPVLVASLAFVSDVRAEDAYVHSDGTQYLDTGYVIKSTTRVELDMALDAAMTSGDQYFFGTTGNKTGRLSFCAYTPASSVAYSAGKYCYCCQKDAADWVATSYTTSTDRRTIVMDGYHNLYAVVQGGVTNFMKGITGPHADCNAGVTMPVFAAYNLASGAYLGKMAAKLYALRIYEADCLVREFVPCVWGGEVGLKDLTSGGFRSPAVGNELTFGGDILTGDDGYIQSTGDQYVDTGYCATGNTRVEVDMSFVDPATSANKYVFGVSGAPSGLIYGVYVGSTGYCGWNCKDSSGNWSGFGIAASSVRRTYVVDGSANKSFTVTQGVTNNLMEMTAEHTGTTYYTLPIFGTKFNARDVVSSKVAMKLYGFRIYESGKLVRNFVPCVKGGIAGLKETVEDLFYTDRPGDGAVRLAGGGDILKEDDDPFVKGSGFQAFDSGIVVDSTTRLELDFTPAQVSGTKYLLGSTTSANGHLVFGAYIKDGALVVNCQTNAANWQSIGTVSDARKKVVFDVLNGRVQVYESNVLLLDVAMAGKRGGTGEIYVTKNSIPLLGNGSAGSPTSIMAATVYGCAVYTNGVLAKNFKPYVANSVVGLRDSVTGTFITSPRSVTGFEAGGDIMSDVEENAYLSSNQRQAINTGYLVNADSRIEVDFALNQHTNGLERVFGATVCTDYPFGLYANSSDATWGYFCFAAGSSVYNTMVPVDVARHTAIVDMKKKWVLFVTGSKTNYWADITAVPSGTVWPMALFGETADASFTTAQRLSNLRIYSVKISESGQLVQHYLPYKSADQVGLKDVVTGVVKQDVLDSGEPFTVGCRGWGETHVAFYENPTGGTVSSGETKVLSAFAPGAVAYQWLKDGTPIDGATGMTYSVSWQRRAPDAAYAVRADFSRYGITVQSTSDAATVVNRPNGLIITVR